MHIIQIKGREILDSRGNPTVEVDVLLEQGVMGRASAPAGASMGKREACELRDGDPHRYHGMGVMHAVRKINEQIHPALYQMPITDQTALDNALCELDGTENKSRLGANAILAVSLAAARAHALAMNKPLFEIISDHNPMIMPVPMMNILNGGLHADNNLDIQEIMIMPIGAADFPSALRMGVEIFHTLKQVLKNQGLSTAVGDEGGFAPDLKSNRHALDLLSESVHKAGFVLQKDVVFALDIAASELYDGTIYRMENASFTPAHLINYYAQLLREYPIVSIEDGLDETDWDGWKDLTYELGQHVQLVGDDLFVTNDQLLANGIRHHCANAILIKLNQIGTLTETKKTMQLAEKNGYACVVSHRSGETEDTFIADLAVATGCGQIKTGSLCRSERMGKYNQLLRIYEQTHLSYAGRRALKVR